MNAPAPVVRYASLQIGRGLAAILVVLHHTLGRARVAGLDGGLADFGLGFLGVDFFFVLSGFIIAYCVDRPGLSAHVFLWRRAVRILPVFWLVFAVSGLAVWLMPHLLGHPVSYSVAELVKAAFLLRQDIADGRSNPPIVGVAWTLHHEVLFYAIAGLWLTWRRSALVLAAVLWLGSLREPTTYPMSFLLNPLNLEFAFGLLAHLAHRRMGRAGAWTAIVMGVLLLPVLCRAWPPLDQFVNASRVWSAGLPLALIVAGLAAVELRCSAGQSRLPDAMTVISRALEHLGDWSYALYLSHYPVMLLCLKLARPSGSSGALGLYAYLVGTVALCLAVAALLHIGFERPVQRWLNRPRPFTSSRRSALPP
jgi:peptidoglycan/LPS O-acetylase OafA/YrhL